MDKKPTYFALAYYLFTPIEDPVLEVKRHQDFFSTRDCSSRIYFSHEGVNGQMSARADHAEEYMNWLREDPRFAEVEFKVHLCQENIFPKKTVKARKQLVALDAQVDLSQAGEHLSSERWKEMLEKRDENTLILDVRNDYEWEVGHFEGAELPKLETFREFPAYARSLKESRDPKETKVMMYCTGGIRCELYSALLKQEGFENVFQLQGGVIKYGAEQGSSLWKGKLFVFDDRMVVPLSEDAEPISKCLYCNTPADLYYNCANMDCNALFICCPSCAAEKQGCCGEACTHAPRLRPHDPAARPKPFRKLPFDQK